MSAVHRIVAPAVVVLMLSGMQVACGASSELDGRLKHLETELRCLVCQNQTLADSNASLADDLRHEVRSLAETGMSDDDIKAYLVARYGDFVLYRPPVKPITYLLWVGPFALLLAGGAVAWRVVARRPRTTSPGAETRDLANARALLDDSNDLNAADIHHR